MSDRTGIACGVQLKDVYDYAYDIAQEFDKIVDLVDIEQAKPLINKIINVLEILEDSVKQLELLEQENAGLKAKYTQWSSEKTANDEEKLNLKQAFEELEESWAQESAALKSFIEKLKKENHMLKNSISSKKEVNLETDDCVNNVIKDQEKLITKLQLHLKQRDAQIENYHSTIEQLNLKVEDLLMLNKSLHLRYQDVKDLLKVSYSEKYEQKFKQDLQEQKILDLENKYEALRKSLIERNEGSEVDPTSTEKKVEVSEYGLKYLLEEQQELKQTISILQSELQLVKYQCEEYKRKLLKVAEVQNKDSSEKSGRIQQIFRLFLGVVHINI